MRHLVILGMVCLLASCGGASRSSGKSYVTRTASGPISQACLASDRKARSRGLCGCIQAAANQTLSGGDQRLAASFYTDPQKAQDIRQSDRSRDSAFWKRYRNYSETATAICS